MTDHVLLVSPQGLIEVLHSELPIDVRSYLTTHGDGEFVSLSFTSDYGQAGTVSFMADPVGPLNPRARDVLASLTGVHVILTGSVAFSGLTPDQVVEAVRGVG